jgi:tRNA threonylcarbamoyladenosine biosynthesis protein TsaE
MSARTLLAIIAPASPAALAVSEPRSAEVRGSSRALTEANDPDDVRRQSALIVALTVPNTVAGLVNHSRLTTSPKETEMLGRELARALAPGDVVLVAGELGAGKTTFVRGAVRALGVAAPVTSPTFTIGQRYRGRVPVAHLDLYRVEDLEAEDPDLLAEYVRPDTIAFVEWPSHGEGTVAGFGRIAARVVIEHAGGDSRRLTIERS